VATPAESKILREGSVRKRAAILAAAREKFLAEGFERVSMDAIASLAAVSKRTVYDYYGDKRALLLAVVEQAIDGLGVSVAAAIDGHLREVVNIEDALVGFATAITDSAIGSSDYTALMRLLSSESDNLPEMREKHWQDIEPEDAVAERFAALTERGALDTPNPRRAADHFVALTLSPSVYALGRPALSSSEDTRDMIIDGVRAFLRAYAPRV